MKAVSCISLLIGLALVIQIVDCFDYCYRASFETDAATNGNATSRKNEIETAVNDILNELRNDSALGFTTSGSNATLDEVLGNSSKSIYVVSICLTNSSLDENQLTQNLETFNFTTQIDNMDVTAGDFDECAGNFTTNCAELATCNNNNGSFACRCPDTYSDRSDNNATGEICVLPTNHTCGSSTVDVVAYQPYFNNLGISASSLKLGDCNGTESGETTLFSGECSPTIDSNDTHIIYRWNLTNIDPDDEITIGNYVIIPFVCSFLSNGTVNITFNGSAAESVVFGENLFLDNSASSLDIQISAFSDTGFLNSLSAGSTIKTNQDLGFEMGPQNGFISDNLKTVCQGLTSGPAEGTIEPMRLIESGCKVNDPQLSPLLNTLSIIEQGTGPVATLTLSAHFYLGSTVTQLGFEVYVCYESGGSSCEPTCNARRRRSVVRKTVKRQSEEVASGVGYFFFRQEPNDVCTRDCGLGACVLGSGRSQDCACSRVNTYKDESGKCFPLEDFVAPLPEEDNSQIVLIVLICVISLSFLGSVVLIFAILRRRRRFERRKPKSDM